MEFLASKVDGVLMGHTEKDQTKLAEFGTNVVFKVTPITDDKRTLLQNAAMHKFFELLANAMNDAGITKKIIFEKSSNAPWTGGSVKEDLWRPVQKALVDVASTTELTTVDPGEIHKELMLILGENFGVPYISWPNRFGA